jgi:16S rRNA (uracil1498-N3)-methyltransferase
MALPYFYLPSYDPAQEIIVLEEDSSRHIAQVLRMKTGEQLQLTDGKGNLLKAEIVEENKKNCKVRILNAEHKPQNGRKITIAISLLKNLSRFEWFLEKATEIGVTEIIPLICERTENKRFRSDRMKTILISAMLQSQQTWLPVLQEPVDFNKAIQGFDQQQKFIAHCMEEEKRNLGDLINNDLASSVILIGPEGDFTKPEVESALENHFIPVALGETRLRTETAGIVAATLLKIKPGV